MPPKRANSAAIEANNGNGTATLLDEPATSLTIASDEDSSIVDVDLLALHGINQADINKLKEKGAVTVLGAHAMTKRRMQGIKGLSEVKVEKIKSAVEKMIPFVFQTGLQVRDDRSRCLRISTGSKQLDSILLGGFETMSVCEVFGEFRCGKTQLAHTLAVTAQLPKEVGGAEGKVAWLDTEGTFRPERIAQIAERFGFHPEQCLENINVARVYNSELQSEFLDLLAPSLATNQYRLIIIDSVMNLYRSDYIGRGELQERQSNLALFLRKLAFISAAYNVLVFMTNHVQSDPGASALFASVDGRKPTGGHVLAHASTTRILLRKGRGEERVAKIIDSPEAPEREAIFIITDGGINDPNQA